MLSEAVVVSLFVGKSGILSIPAANTVVPKESNSIDNRDDDDDFAEEDEAEESLIVVKESSCFRFQGTVFSSSCFGFNLRNGPARASSMPGATPMLTACWFFSPHASIANDSADQSGHFIRNSRMKKRETTINT